MGFEPCQGQEAADRSRFAAALEIAFEHLPAAVIYVSHEPEELPPTLWHLLELEEGRVVRRSDSRLACPGGPRPERTLGSAGGE